MIADTSRPFLPTDPETLKPVAVPIVQAMFLAPLVAGPAAFLALTLLLVRVTGGLSLEPLSETLAALLMAELVGYIVALPVCAALGAAMTLAAWKWPPLRRTWVWVTVGAAVGGLGFSAATFSAGLFVGAFPGAACAWLFRLVMRQSFGR